MLVQTGLGEVGVGAFVAVVGLLLGMHPDHMLVEVNTLCKLVLTHVASERLLQLVHALVGFQVGGGGEDLRRGEMQINSSLECSIECVEGTRPSVNYAKDWLGQLFLIRGLVSSEKGNHSWM